MDDIPPLLKLTTNCWWLLLLLLGSTALFHLFLVHVRPLGKVGWKRADYVWLDIASLGLISMAAEVRVWISKNWLDTATHQTQFTLHMLRSNLVTSPPKHLCTKFVRGEYSPPNFEEIQEQYDSACEWLKSAARVLPPDDKPPFKPLNFLDTHFPESINNPIILDTANQIKSLFEEYEIRRIALEDLERQTKRTAGEDINFAFSPIFLCIALALRITKVTGEIRLERKA